MLSFEFCLPLLHLTQVLRLLVHLLAHGSLCLFPALHALSLKCQLNAVPILFELPELAGGERAFLLLSGLGPKLLLLCLELGLTACAHILHHLLLSEYLFLFNESEPPLLLNLKGLNLALKLLLPEAAFELGPVGLHVHLGRLLVQSLPDELALEPLLLVLNPPPLLGHTVPVLFLSLPGLELSPHLPDSLLTLVALQHL